MQKRNKYLSSFSKNAEQVKVLLTELERTELTERKIRAILAGCAERLLRERFKDEELVRFQWLIVELGKCDCGFEREEYRKNGVSFAYEYNEDLLGFLYLSLSALKERKKSGSYYTPKDVAKRLINGVVAEERMNPGDTNAEEHRLQDLKILDPACGTGSILLELPMECKLQQIYGYDIDPIAIAIIRINMALKYQVCDKKLLTEHFQIRDFLMDGSLKRVDLILGNPPWGATFTQKERIALQEKYLTAGQKLIESGDLFVEQSLKVLQPGGQMCFVLPEALLHVKTHRIVRSLILGQSTILRVEYLGEVFEQVQCPSVILTLEKRKQSEFEAREETSESQSVGLETTGDGIEIITENRRFTIHAGNCGQRHYQVKKVTVRPQNGNDGLRRFAEDGFLLDATEEEFALLQKLSLAKNKVTLKGQAMFALGIVTGNNAKHLMKQKEEGSEPILRGNDIEQFKVKEASSYICFVPGSYQQVAPVGLYRAPEKLLYRFVGEQPIFAYDNRQTLTLNSCNIVIPEVENMDMRYIMAVFNSSVIEFWHRRVNHSMKLLRAHVEAFPIPIATWEQQQEIIRLVGLLEEDEQSRNILDEKVAELFGLTDAEYDLIRMACKE